MASRKKLSMADVFVDFAEVKRTQRADRQMLIRCTEKERQSIKRTAAELGLPISAYMRLLHRTALRSAGREMDT